MKITKNKVVLLMKTLISASAVSIFLSMQTSNILIAVIAILLYYFYKNIGDKQSGSQRECKVSIAIGAIFTFFMFLKGFEKFDHYTNISGIGKIAILLCITIGFFLLFQNIIYVLYVKMFGINIINDTGRHISAGKVFFIVFVVLLVCWLPHYLMNYPGIVISDSCDQIGQGITGNYSNHHPVVHTWMIQFFIESGVKLFGNLNDAVALYCVFQMIVLAAVYAYVISLMYGQKIKRWICCLFIAFYAFMPYNVMYSFNMWKDSLFSAAVLLFIAVLWKVMVIPKTKSKGFRIIDLILLLLSGLVICLFRNNGFYAFLLMLPFVCIFCYKENKDIIIAAIGVLLITVFVKGPVFSYFEVRSPDMVESLSIPIQQIGRVVKDGLELSEEERAWLEQIVEVDRIPETYNPQISDPMKSLVRASENQQFLSDHKLEYLKVWMTIGFRYPFHYIRAYISQTEGYWNPDIQYWVYADGVYDSQIEIYADPVIPKEAGKYFKLLLWDNYDDIPFYGLLWSIGAAVWMSIFLAGFCIVRGRVRELCLFLPIGALWGTIMVATPVHAEFRYIYAIFLCMPLFIVIALFTSKGEKQNEYLEKGPEMDRI